VTDLCYCIVSHVQCYVTDRCRIPRLHGPVMSQFHHNSHCCCF